MKPRNHVVLALLRSNKGSQIHGKSKKALRKADKNSLSRSLRNESRDLNKAL